jgi:competence protein ComEA
MKIGWVIALSVVCAFLAAGILYLAASPPRGEAVILLPPPTPLPVVVQVSGAVNRPGLYSLPPGSRIHDALVAAGGLSSSAELATLNLAAYVEDGQRIEVPSRQATPLTLKATLTAPPSSGIVAGPSQTKSSAQPPPPTGLININTATQAELESLPGIGPSLAQRILAYREENGLFKTIEDIQQVKGIGPAIFDRIKDLITAGE